MLLKLSRPHPLPSLSKKRRGQQNHHETVLYNRFVKNSVPFWEKLQHRSLALMDSFRPKWLVSVGWAFATVLDPVTRCGNVLDVSPFFNGLHKSFNQRRGEFSSKHMGNLAWSYMSCRQKIPQLLNDFSDEFIHRRKRESAQVDDKSMMDDGLDPITLCQWANAFAKSRHKDKDIFQSLSIAAIPILCEFNARHFSNLAYACALAEVVPKLEDGSSLFDEIAAAASPRIPTFDPQNMANILWAYAKMEHASPDLFDALAKEAMPRLREFSAQQLANLAWSLAKFPPSSPDGVFDRIAEDVVARGLDSFTSQGLAMLAHSFATVGHVKNTDFWDTLDRAATARISELGPVECSQIAWSFATIGRPADDLFHGIKSIVTSKMDHIKPQGISNIAWSFAMLGYDSPDFFEAVAQQSIQRLNEFTPHDKAMLVLAFTRISHPFPELFEQIASGSVSQLSRFSGLDLFNMVISYVKAGHQSEPWMEALADEIVLRPSSFSPRMIVGIAWAYSSAGFRIPALFNSLSNECINHCDKLESKEVASLAWSFASIDYFHRPLLGALADSSDGRWNDFDAPSLANMAWAYATAQEDRPRLFEGIAKAATHRSNEFTSQGVSMLLWACSVSGHTDRHLFDSLAPRATELLHECNSQALANIAWAYTVANVDADSLFGNKSPFIDVLAERIDEFDHQGLRQLHQWNIWRKEIAADAVLPPILEKLCYDTFTDQSLRRSKLQKGVMSELVLMGIHPEEEFQTQSGYHLDALVDVNGKKLGVEVDGPSHFVGRKPTGSTIVKHRQVSKADGIEVVSLPYWELNDLESSDEKQRYLRAKLGIEITTID